MNVPPGPARQDAVDVVAGGVAQYVTSRDAAALLGVPEPKVRQLVRGGTLAGFRAGGYWIACGAAVARYAASTEGALARLRTDFPRWRIQPLSSGFFAITGAGPTARAVVLVAATVGALRDDLQTWHACHPPVGGDFGRGGWPQPDAPHRRPRRRSVPAARRRGGDRNR